MTVEAQVAALDPIGLADLAEVAELHQRHDAKYLLTMQELIQLVDTLGDRMLVLEVGGDRVIGYYTVYFDTPDLMTYRWHVQRRRRRYKVRTRHYGDPTASMLELKLKVARDQTLKHRWPHPDGDPEVLGDRSRAVLATALLAEYGTELPPRLVPSARTTFRRVTLVEPVAGERMTIDMGLGTTVHDRAVAFDTDMVVVECKTPSMRGALLRTMLSLGHRPANVSKYGVAVAATRSDPLLPRGNAWLPSLRELARS